MDLFKEFKNEWFQNENWWFNPSEKDDIYICKKYKDLLYKNIESTDLLTLILINDQLTRHYKRVTLIDIIDERLVIALNYSQKLLEFNKYGQLIKQDNLTWKEWCFILLPFRHAGQPIIQITECIINALKNKQVSLNESDNKFLRKYLKATFMKYSTKFLPLHENLKKITVYNSSNILEYNPVEKNTRNSHKKNIQFIISLSGGVDSMVLAYRYRDVAVAVHIDYNNRKESNAEAVFVQNWCFNNGIKCFTRVITEINKKTCIELGLRDLYESYTKQIRFDTYLAVWKSLGKKNVPQVILGHHIDDCIENIISNISKLRWHDLNGMSEERLIKVGSTHINIIRPLLNTKLNKSEIVKEARLNEIPYLLDTTSINCSRGKLRSNIIPGLINWNSNSLNGLYNLANMTDEANDLINILVTDWIEKLNTGGITLNINLIPENKLLYREIFCRYHIYPSNKSIINFTNCIKKIKKNQKQFVTQKTEFCKNTFIIINKINLSSIILSLHILL